MRKTCSNCNFSKLIKYKEKEYGYINSYEVLFCTFNPPSSSKSTIYEASRITFNYAIIQRYYYYPNVTNCASCHQHQKKSSKEMIRLEEIYKKEKEQEKLEKEQKKLEKEQEREKKIVLLAKIKKDKDEKKKTKLRIKKRREYQKEYRAKIKAEELTIKLEKERCDRFEIMDL